MKKGFNKKIILFAAGTGGNFLANWLLVDNDLLPNPSFRIDKVQQTTDRIQFISGHRGQVDSRLNDFDSEQCLRALVDWLYNSQAQIALSHYRQIYQLQPYVDQAWIRKIHPVTNIFGCLKNICYKKQHQDWINYSQTPFSYQFDQIFEGLKDWYFKLTTDTDSPEDLLIDFGKLYNIDYLNNLFVEANGIEPDSVKIFWAQQYLEKQYTIMDDCDYLDLQQIINHINPTDVFDLAVVLFIYEKNNKTIDSNRLWSINNLPNTVEEGIDFFLENSRRYIIF